MSVSETELRRAIAILDAYRAELEALQRQSDIVQLSLEEFLRARETLARFQQAGAGAELLVPIGANSYVLATSRDVETAFVSIGSEYIIQDGVPSALERLDDRIQSIRETAENVGARLVELERRVQAQSDFVQSTLETLQSGTGTDRG